MIKSLITQFKRKKFYSGFIGKNDLCFDIGANIGGKSKLFLSLGARVIGFEPQTRCYEKLTVLEKENRRFSFHPFAVGAKNEEKVLHLANHIEVATLSEAFIDYFTCDEIYWKEKETVTSKTLDDLIEEFGLPNFCKIDVEGYEYEILSNLHYRIPLIEFEFTAGFIDNTLKIIDSLTEEGVVFNYMANENPEFKLRQWVSGDQMKAIVSSLPTARLHGNIFVKS
jgi:FkbM family methyltransferase